MNTSDIQGFANGRTLGFLILFAVVVAGIFAMNRWIKSNLEDGVDSPVSVSQSAPQSSTVPPAASSAGEALQVAPALADSSIPSGPLTIPSQENKIIYETPLKDTILVQ